MAPTDDRFFGFQQREPLIDPSAYVAPGARLIGSVVLGARASVWFNCVLRADLAEIEIGEGSNIQDLTMVHVEGLEERGPGEPRRPCIIGKFVTVGHNCVVHSCIIEDDCLIGMHATVMSGAHIGRGSVVAAGSVVLEETVIPPFSLVVGSPGRVRKTYPPDVIEKIIRPAADSYLLRVAAFGPGLRTLPSTGH
ncbi:MAG: gamma carbonic anhydrase family protein [bacterium]